MHRVTSKELAKSENGGSLGFGYSISAVFSMLYVGSGCSGLGWGRDVRTPP